MSITVKGVAIVTGAAQGIGRAIALRLAKDGFNVSLNDIHANEDKLKRVAEQISGGGVKAISTVGDVSEEKDVYNLVNKTVNELGDLKVMVANAGICRWGSLVETDTDAIKRTFDVNIKGVLFSYKYAALQMIKQGKGGRIIGASSVAGKQGVKDCSVYTASKFAVRGLTQSAALELGKYGITVNAYAPGAINTDLLRHLNQVLEEKTGAPPGSMSQTYKDASPLQRLGEDNDIASLVSFLASEDSSFITGQSVSSNGGIFFD